MGEQTAAAGSGHASAGFAVPRNGRDAAIGVAFVRDGAMEYATRPDCDRRTRSRATTTLSADKAAYSPGSVAHMTIADGNERAGATLAIRLADSVRRTALRSKTRRRCLAGPARRRRARPRRPGLARLVAPTRSTVVDFAGSERSAPQKRVARRRVGARLVWRIDRADKEGFDLALPETPGRYVVSVLKVSDDGDVGAATLAIEVR